MQLLKFETVIFNFATRDSLDNTSYSTDVREFVRTYKHMPMLTFTQANIFDVNYYRDPTADERGLIATSGDVFLMWPDGPDKVEDFQTLLNRVTDPRVMRLTDNRVVCRHWKDGVLAVLHFCR